MDPITLLGATAASGQLLGYVIKGVLGTVTLGREVKDAPSELLQLLDFLDKEIAAMNKLLRPDSTVFTQLSVDQYAQISPIAIEARRALEDLNLELKPLVIDPVDTTDQNGAAARIVRIWKSGMTAKALRSINSNLKVIERLNSALIRDLQIAGFETHGQLRDYAVRTVAMTEAASIRTESMHQLVQTGNEAQNQRIDILNNSIANVSQAINDSRTEAIISHQNIAQLAVNSEASNLIMSRIEKSVENHGIIMTSQLQARDESLMAFIRQQGAANRMTLFEDIQHLLQQRMTTVVACAGDNAASSDLEFSNSKFQVDIPAGTATLTCRSRTNLHNHGVIDRSEPYRSPRPLRCKCHQGKSVSVKNYGRIGFEVQRQSSRSCPLHGKVSGLSYTLRANLSPWLSGAMELTLGVLQKGRQWEISRPLRFRAVVKRSESPMFRLFDEFIFNILRRWRWRNHLNRGTYWNETHRFYGYRHNAQISLIPDEQTMKQSFSRLICGIEDAMKRGDAHASDVDENGHTILLEITRLILLTRESTFDFFAEFEHLINLAKYAKVDPTTAYLGNIWDANRFAPLNINSGIPIICHLFRHLDQAYFSWRIFQLLKEYEGILEPLAGLLDQERKDNGWVRNTNYWFLMVSDPDSAEVLELSDVSIAIARRSMSALQRSLSAHHLPLSRHEQWAAMQLAVGWPLGLQFLVERGWNIASAFNTACYLGDAESATILLSTETALFSDGYEVPGELPNIHTQLDTMLNAACLNKDIFLLVAKELGQLQEQLRMLVTRHLRAGERLKLGITEPWSMDYYSPDLFGILAKRITIPAKLDICAIGSPHCNCAPRGSPLTHIVFHQILFDNGFTDLNASCRHGHTPLAVFCNKFYWSHSRRSDWQVWVQTIQWFLSRMASVELGSTDGYPIKWPHLQFYAAEAIRWTGLCDREIMNACGRELIKDLCQCYCSSSGCVPAFSLWRCGGYHLGRRCNDRVSMPYRSRCLDSFIKSSGFARATTESCYREIVCLEVFERLGLTHTCCARAYALRFNENGRRLSYEALKELKMDIRCEEEETAEQLKQYMLTYIKLRLFLFDVPIQRFWTYWWDVVGVILPPLLPDEAYQCSDWYGGRPWKIGMNPLEVQDRITQIRDYRWVAALNQAGYSEEWDYMDIIKIHLVGCLRRAKEHRQRVISWKQHRLVSKPKFLVKKHRRPKRNTSRASSCTRG